MSEHYTRKKFSEVKHAGAFWFAQPGCGPRPYWKTGEDEAWCWADGAFYHFGEELVVEAREEPWNTGRLPGWLPGRA